MPPLLAAATYSESVRERAARQGKRYIDSRFLNRSVASPCDQCSLPGGVPARTCCYTVKSVNQCDWYIIAAEIVEDRQTALSQFAEIVNDLKR